MRKTEFLMTATQDAPPNIEAPRPEPLPYTWPNQDLRNLVQLAPMSPYTRALLRIKYNRPVPENCTTFEQIDAWLATLPAPAPTPQKAAPSGGFINAGNTGISTYERRRREIANGEFLNVTGKIDGYEYRKEYWTKECTVEVPLSVFEEGEDAVRDYVDEEVRECDPDYGDSDYDSSEDDGIEIEEDLDDLMAEAEEMIRIRDGEDEDEDEE